MRPGSKKWKKFMAKLYGWGASVVILGALFKIQHWPGANVMLIVGLGTEAVIFFFSAFEPLHEDPKWELVYPELKQHDEEEEIEVAAVQESYGEDKGSVIEQLDDMLEEAKIDSDLIESLGVGLRSLGEQAGNLNKMSDASAATDEYVENLKGASSKVGELSNSYERASESLNSISESTAHTQQAGENLQRLSDNLSALNSLYEVQLESSKEKLESTNKLFEGINDIMANLNESVESTRVYKDNIAQLSENLSSLNTVYGNMLAAMNVNSNHG